MSGIVTAQGAVSAQGPASAEAILGSGAEAAIAGLSFEEALAELERIVRSLEGGQQRLEESIAAYERGSALRRHCEDKLRQAEMRVDKIVTGTDGRPAGSSALDEDVPF